MQAGLWIIPVAILAALPGVASCQTSASEQKAPANKKSSSSFLNGPPFTLEQLQRLLREDVIPMRRRREAIENRGVDFAITPDIVKKLKAEGATSEILEFLQRNEQPAVVSVTIPKPEPTGRLTISCEPAECDVSLNGAERGSSDGGVMELAGLRPGKWMVDISKQGYVSVQRAVTIEPDQVAAVSAALDPTRATEEVLGAELFEKIVNGLGGEAGLSELASVQASGSTTIARDGSSVRWTVLMRNRPDRALFQARAGAILHEVGFTGNEFMASKNLKGEDAMELPTDFGFIRDNQLAALITRLRNPRFKLMAKHARPIAGEEFPLIAESPTETISIGLDDQLRPQKVRITTETGVGSALITYDDYFTSGNAAYPKTMLIKPDGRTHGIEVRFDVVELNSSLKDSDYKLRGKPLPNLAN